MARILVVDDEALIRQELQRLLRRRGYEVETAGSVQEATELELSGFDLVLCDLRLPGEDGMSLLARSPAAPVLIMTSYSSVRSAVEAMRRGAVDYIAKPLDERELLGSIERIIGARRSCGVAEPKPGQTDRPSATRALIGSSPLMTEMLERVERVAPTRATVLIVGESGTGKELVARSIHAQSNRRSAAFVAVSCAAIPDGLFESELFGHERGAFTGAHSAHAGLVEAADGGTLFLDEVGELPLSAQARLLRLLQESEIRRVGSNRVQRVDTRLIAATHRDLPRMIAEGAFREDLYFRLRVLQLRVPALRERLDDLPELANALLARVCQRLGRDPLCFEGDAYRELARYHWPGNVRELENAIERAVILTDGGTIAASALGIGELERDALASGSGLASDVSIEGYFRRFVLDHQEVLTETEIAQRLGLSRKSLWERRRRLGIPRPKTT